MDNIRRQLARLARQQDGAIAIATAVVFGLSSVAAGMAVRDKWQASNKASHGLRIAVVYGIAGTNRSAAAEPVGIDALKTATHRFVDVLSRHASQRDLIQLGLVAPSSGQDTNAGLPDQACARPRPLPLAADVSAVRDRIDQLPPQPSSVMPIGSGVTEASQILTADTSRNDTAPVRNIIIVLNDGPQVDVRTDDCLTTVPGRTAPQTLHQASLTACGEAKQEIEIYSIAVTPEAGPGKPVHSLLKDCATSPENFFYAEDGEALAFAFETIAEEITAGRSDH